MKRLSVLWTALLTLVLGALVAGCAAVGQQQPRGAEDSLQYAKATLAGVYRTLSGTLDNGSLEAQAVRRYRDRARNADDALQVAEKELRLGKAGSSTFVEKMALATSILQDLAVELRRRYPDAKIPNPVPAPA